jgi:hypothetical protein
VYEIGGEPVGVGSAGELELGHEGEEVAPVWECAVWCVKTHPAC